MVTATREEKQIDILKAAVRVFSEYGFDGSKMEYIAREAGVGKGTVYEYFESKDQLFEQILKFSVNQYGQGLKRCIQDGKTTEEKIVNCIRFSADFLSNHLEFMHIAMQVKMLSKEVRAHHTAAYAAILRGYREMIREGKENGELRQDLNEDLAAICIIGALEQFCRQRIYIDQRALKKKECLAVADMLLKGFKAFK